MLFAILISDPERRNVIMRIKLASDSETVPKSVILKQVLPRPEDSDNREAIARFARDWAGLAFASQVQEREEVHATPVFYGSDSELLFILIEDLGDPHVSLVDSLLVADRERATEALERYMHALAEFHTTGYGQNARFTSILAGIHPGARTVEQDLAETTDYLLPQMATSIQLLELGQSEAFLDDVRHVLDAMFEPGPFTVLTHGDIAPDNVFDGDKGLQLIDFEVCALRNALLDATYLRMCIPTGWCAKAVPEDLLEHLETLYRTDLAQVIPEASDDLAYSTSYVHACAYHVLYQMAHLHGCLEQDQLWGGPMPQYPLWEQMPNSSRARFLSRLEAFIEVADKHSAAFPDEPPILPSLKAMAENMLAAVKARWGDEAKPLDVYPAFLTSPSEAYKGRMQDMTGSGEDEETPSVDNLNL